LLLLDSASGKESRRLASSSGPVGALAFTPDGKKLVSSVQGAAVVWDIKAGKIIHTIRRPVLLSGSMALSRDGETLALGTHRHAVQIWDVTTGKELLTKSQGHDSPIVNLAFSPGGTILASAGAEEILLWDVSRRQRIGTLPILAPPFGLSFSTDGA